METDALTELTDLTELGGLFKISSINSEQVPQNETKIWGCKCVLFSKFKLQYENQNEGVIDHSFSAGPLLSGV